MLWITIVIDTQSLPWHTRLRKKRLLIFPATGFSFPARATRPRAPAGQSGCGPFRRRRLPI